MAYASGLDLFADMEVISDASGSVGFGALSSGTWFYGSWVAPQVSLSIAYKALFQVVIAAVVWGATWLHQHVLLPSYNEAVVHIINTRSSKVPVLMHLLWDLLMSAACFSFSFSTTHVPGAQN